MRKALIRSILAIALLSLSAGLFADGVQPVLYGGNGGHANGDSINDGFLVIVNQTTPSLTCWAKSWSTAASSARESSTACRAARAASTTRT